nr:centrosomal protein of 192 kDa [Anolis sagrei ordinatus]
MFVARSIAADHRDLIHDVSFDFHGRRMATCSSDQSVKVWDKGENGEWHCTASWKTHSGSVWRVTWAHPEFGQVLASCSFDRTAAVWEEIVGESNDKLRGQSHWVKRTTLVDSRTSVTDVKFAPKHMGLMLATCSADGVVRIYEAPDVMNLSQWSLQHEISCKLSCSCISWNPSSSRAHAPMIAVGSDDSSPNVLAKVQIYEYNENTRKYAKAETLMTVTDPVHDIAFAPNLGRSFHLLAVATKDVRIFTLKPLRKELTTSSGLTKFEVQLVAQFDNHNSQVWRVSWNITGTVLASSGDDGCVRLWKANYMDNWKCTGILKGNGSPVNASSSQQGAFNAPFGTSNTSLQNSVNGTSAGRYFFPPLDSPRAGSRWSSYAQLLPPPPPPPLIERSCDADTANLQYPHRRTRYISRPLKFLREHEGVESSIMEDFKGIADETLPSILDHSLTIHTSEILDNITMSSNLGLPVAASTEARQKTDPHGRLCDQASFMEREFSAPLASSCSGESDSYPRRKLSLQDTVENCNKTTETLLEVDQNESDLQRRQNQNCTEECVDIHKDIAHENLSLKCLEDLRTTIFASLKKGSENNKVSSSEPGQKRITSNTDVNGVTAFSRFIENEKLLSYASLEEHSTDDDLGDEEFCDDQLEAYFEQLALPEIEDTEEHELGDYMKAVELPPDQEHFQTPTVCQAATRTDSYDTGSEQLYDIKETRHCVKDEQFVLTVSAGEEQEDRSSDCCNKCPVGITGNVSGMFIRTDKSHICQDVKDHLDEYGEDEIPIKTNQMINTKNANRDYTESQPPCITAENTCNKDATDVTNSELKLDSVYFQCVENTITSEIWNKEQQTPFSPLCQEASESYVPLAEVYLSPSAYTGTEHDECTSEDDPPHDVVYQDEEGRWVTDLAYYTSFDKEQTVNVPNVSGDFVAGSEAVAMIAQDQEDFEKEHRFMQEEKMDPQNTSVFGDSSWRSFHNFNPSRASEINLTKNASYFRISLGEFFGQRSEALGCLGGGGDVKRPSFGYDITSPEKRQPVPLLNQSIISSVNIDEQTLQISDSLQGDVGNNFKEESHIASATFNLGEVGSPMEDNMSEKLEASKIQHGHHNGEASILSISTIASAIADASVSTEPSQLAALMMKLSSKNRKEANIPEVTKLKDFSAIRKLLSTSAANSKPENMIEHEEISSDEHKSDRQERETASSGEPSKNNFCFQSGKERQHLEKMKEESSIKDLHCDASSSEWKEEMKNTEKASNIGECFQTEKVSSVTFLKESLSKSIETPSEDYVTKLPGDTVVVKQKLATPVTDAEASENEQYSFRPSTSPLIHSSPSDTSSTASSRSDCPHAAPNFKESSCNDTTLPQLGYTDPSFQQLTFISATENTLNNVALSTPETSQTNRPIELSTTIVWTSPTSSLELESGKKRDLQNKIHQPRKHPKKLEVDESVEPICLRENQKSTGELPPKSEDESTQNHPNNNELTCVDVPATEHDSKNTTQKLGLSLLKNVPAFDALDGCRTNFKNSGVASDYPPTYSGIPTLLTGCSLTRTPFAQHYLESLQSQTNVALPQYHVGCPPVFGVPAGLIYSAIPLDHVQNSLTAGLALHTDMTSRVLGTTPHYNFPSNQNRLSPSKTGQIVERKESMPLGFVRVKVPAEVKFPYSCCVGLTSHTVLSILNPSERWLQVSINLLSIMFNGEKMDPQNNRCLLFKNKTVIGPCTSEDLKMLFLPCKAGVFQCVLSVASWPFSADADIVVQAEVLSSRVTVNAVAENPDIEVEAGKTNHLDFGDLPSGSWKALPLKLTNKTCARVPVRLVIHANAIAWRCFTFSKEPVNSTLRSADHTYNISQLAAPSVISHIMNASCDQHDPEVLVVWVQFQAPCKSVSSDCLGPADEYFARIDVELDCPEPANVLRSVPLSARCGTPRIFAPRGLQTLYMSTEIGLSTRRQLPLRNVGNIKVDLKIKTVRPDSYISVKPENLVLIPREEKELTVEFSPKDYKDAESVVEILVLPSGPEYKVTVKGEVTMPERKALVQKCPTTEVPPILANKQLLAWGGVHLGRTVQQKLILRNDSSSTTQQLQLLIRGQDQDCFHLKLEERAYNNCEIKIRPKHDYTVCLMFTPSRLACMCAKLEMKQPGLPFHPGIKFTIPLYGYGGKSNVRFEDVKKYGNRYIVELHELSPGKPCQTSFTIQNTGHRSAYVKGVCFKNFCERNAMDPKVMNIFPDKFILKEGLQQKVTVTYTSPEEHNVSSVLAKICVFYGDEIARQQYFSSMQRGVADVQKILPANNPVINVKFDEEFPGQELVTEVYDLPQHSNDLQNFFTNMRRLTLFVVNSSKSKACDVNPSSAHPATLERLDTPEKNSMTLDVLPVKGPHGCPLSSTAHNLTDNQLVSQNTWTLQTEFLILTAPSQNGTTVTKYAQIINNSSRSLKFELSWPAHCLTVTPQHGTIEPKSSISIHVSPNPSLAENKSLFPWSGLVYIHCDGEQKLLRVQIREDTSEKPPEKASSVARVGVQQLAELPVIHIQPLQKPQSTKLEVKNRSLCFPETWCGETAEKYLEIENNGDENVKWFLASFAPPYVKGVDESGEVFRATYTAFRCSSLSGSIEAHGKEKVVVTFLPRDRGQYSQFWELECHPFHKPHMKDKHRLQFCGMGILLNDGLENDISPPALVKINFRDVSQRIDSPDNVDQKIWKGVYAQENVYTFPPTRIGESSTLKVSLRNYSPSSNKLKFRNLKEPFHIKHSHYNLRSYHYCNLPVHFKPASPGSFKGSLVVETEKSGIITIQLIGVGLGEQ